VIIDCTFQFIKEVINVDTSKKHFLTCTWTLLHFRDAGSQ
jgi:hypothetical protein